MHVACQAHAESRFASGMPLRATLGFFRRFEVVMRWTSATNVLPRERHDATTVEYAGPIRSASFKAASSTNTAALTDTSAAHRPRTIGRLRKVLIACLPSIREWVEPTLAIG